MYIYVTIIQYQRFLHDEKKILINKISIIWLSLYIFEFTARYTLYSQNMQY